MNKMVSFDGSQLSYEVLSSNKPICICLHGMNMSKEMFKTKQLKQLLNDYSLILVDLCGYGDSQLNTHLFDMDTMNHLLLKLIEDEKIKECTLCGYCLGGIFALDFTIKNPQYIHHFIMIETMIYLPKWLWVSTLPGYQWGYSLFQKQRWLLKLLEIFPMFHHISSKERIKISQARWNGKINTFYFHLMNQYQKYNHIERCKTMRCPIDIIYSHSSFRLVKKTAKDLSIYPFVSIHECHSKGHFLFLDSSLDEISFH